MFDFTPMEPYILVFVAIVIMLVFLVTGPGIVKRNVSPGQTRRKVVFKPKQDIDTLITDINLVHILREEQMWIGEAYIRRNRYDIFVIKLSAYEVDVKDFVGDNTDLYHAKLAIVHWIQQHTGESAEDYT
jgi:hypothetical protein